MSPANTQLMLLIVIILCGFVVSQGQGIVKMFAFITGASAMALSIYSYWKDKAD